jgi:sigma-B regulation protein RsbU (phosphoserine phosphatase)
MLRTLISIGLPLPELMARTSRVLCESTLPTHYATLVCGRASTAGEVEICNAGHPPPLVIGRGEVRAVAATALPVGMFSSEEFGCETVRLRPGDTMLLYTDGLIEAQNGAGADYGMERLRAFALAALPERPRALVATCVRDLGRFLGPRAPTDDVTIMAMRRS